jgi:glycogen debranching enzyme
MDSPRDSGSTAPASDEAELHISPTGERFEIVGRAAPVRVGQAPGVPAAAREEMLVVTSGGLFACTRRDGDIGTGDVSGEGLYASDTRHLSKLTVTLGGCAPVLLSSSDEAGYEAVVHATNPALADGDGAIVAPQETLNVRRSLLVEDRLHVVIAIQSFHSSVVTTSLEVALAADFADMFEVRGAHLREQRGHMLRPAESSDGVVFGYLGEDEVLRETLVRSDPRPGWSIDSDGAVARWELSLAPRETRRMRLTIEPYADGRRRSPRSREDAAATLQRSADAWRRQCTAVDTDNDLWNRLLDASVRDLHLLSMPAAGGRIPAAGIPWYVAPFGRDSLLTCYQALLLNPAAARETLLVLAALQAQADEAWRDAEPGKIHHELRSGELASLRLIPHTPYYGTVDATPLFLMLAAAYHRWTGDTETLRALVPAMDAALGWIDDHGDRDGDGFIEYLRRSPGGLENQGWKDSHDSIVHADGSLARGPIALVEAQGYVYMAKLRIADVYETLGDAGRAAELRAQAASLRQAFEDAFWMPDEGTYALALDGDKRQVASVTSNPGHCLYCGIVDPARADSVAKRLMGPDMFSGWGIRTLSADSPAFNPMSYHNGSVWPHDNAIAAAGLKRYGHSGAACRVASALYDVAAATRDLRLPELFCGFARRAGSSVVPYPVACSPQAWATAAPFMLLQALLGIAADAGSNSLTVHQPVLPPGLRSVDLRDVRFGGSRISLAFRRERETTSFALVEQTGDARVMLSA